VVLASSEVISWGIEPLGDGARGVEGANAIGPASSFLCIMPRLERNLDQGMKYCQERTQQAGY